MGKAIFPPALGVATAAGVAEGYAENGVRGAAEGAVPFYGEAKLVGNTAGNAAVSTVETGVQNIPGLNQKNQSYQDALDQMNR